MSFGERLRHLRETKGLSREELALRAGLGRGTVRDYEQGHREPSLRSAFQLADALGVVVEEFRNGVEGEAGSPAPTVKEAKPRARARKSPAVASEPQAAAGQAGKKKPAARGQRGSKGQS